MLGVRDSWVVVVVFLCVFSTQLTGWCPRAQSVVGPKWRAWGLQFLAYIWSESCVDAVVDVDVVVEGRIRNHEIKRHSNKTLW